jgi:hypothetical protein
LIVSGEKALLLKPDMREFHEANFAGTAVRMNLSSRNNNSLPKTMRAIMEECD